MVERWRKVSDWNAANADVKRWMICRELYIGVILYAFLISVRADTVRKFAERSAAVGLPLCTTESDQCRATTHQPNVALVEGLAGGIDLAVSARVILSTGEANFVRVWVTGLHGAVTILEHRVAVREANDDDSVASDNTRRPRLTGRLLRAATTHCDACADTTFVDIPAPRPLDATVHPRAGTFPLACVTRIVRASHVYACCPVPISAAIWNIEIALLALWAVLGPCVAFQVPWLSVMTLNETTAFGGRTGVVRSGRC